jgi:aspartate dehydrogenase
MIKVGIIGCGAIGTTLAEAIDSGVVNNVELVALFDLFDDRIETLVQKLNHKPKKYNESEGF